MNEEDYNNQEVLKILKQFSENQEKGLNYCELYELLENHIL